MANPADAKEFARPRCEAAGFDWPTYEKQIQVESGWEHWRADGSVKSSPTGSMGLGQLNSKFYPESDWRDPYTNLTKSIQIVSGYLKKWGSYRKALAGYNWGPGNVGGYTSNGLTHPAWDGTREWRCPHEAVVPQCRTWQRDLYLDVILGPGWPEPGGGVIDGGTTGVAYEDYRDPQPAGRFARMPKGLILHGSRSGVAGNPKQKEYAGTARYEVENANDLGWNATIGENVVALHLTPQEWGWNARAASDDYLAVEIAQATADEPITDPQVDALADYIKRHLQPAWPALPMYFPSHAEVERSGETGYHDGKTDVYPFGSQEMEHLRRRLMERLEAVQPPPGQTDTYAVGPGIRAKMSEHGDKPASDEVYTKTGNKDQWSECVGVSGARYLYVASLNQTFRFAPAA